jgi:hypothetical protein
LGFICPLELLNKKGGERMSEDVNEVPLNDRFQASEKLIERQRGIFSVNKDLTLTLNRLREGCIKDVNSLIGSEQLRAYKELHNEVRAKIVEIPLSFKSTSESKEKEGKYRQKLVKKGQKFIASLDVDKKRIESVLKDYVKKSSSTFDKYLHPKEEAPYVITDATKVPKQTHNPWMWKYPPYSDEWGTYWSSGTRGGRWVSHYENRYTGQIGTQSQIYIHGADDSDWAYTNALSEVWVWYKMPVAGMVEAWLYLQNIDGYYNGCEDDEWGWSNADIKQQSWPYMEVFYPQGGRRYGNLLDFHIGECDCCWSGKVAYANPGDFRYAHLFSTKSYAANQWLLIAFGIHDYNNVWVNDMSVDLAMTNRWFMHHLAIRSTGAP